MVKGVPGMERLTKKTQQGYTVKGVAAAVQRLAEFENFYEGIQTEQRALAEKLDMLKAQGKKDSVRFRQLLGQKMTNSGILVLLKTYNIGK